VNVTDVGPRVKNGGALCEIDGCGSHWSVADTLEKNDESCGSAAGMPVCAEHSAMASAGHVITGGTESASVAVMVVAVTEEWCVAKRAAGDRSMPAVDAIRKVGGHRNAPQLRTAQERPSGSQAKEPRILGDVPIVGIMSQTLGFFMPARVALVGVVPEVGVLGAEMCVAGGHERERANQTRLNRSTRHVAYSSRYL
jgi:hypothetical protein